MLEEPRLVARELELGLIAEFLDAFPSAGGGLLLRGEPGVGKTALLTEAGKKATARDYLVLSASGVQFERDMPFAGLDQLLRPVLHRVEGLSGAQRDAMRAAFGLEAGRAPDLFLIGLATLNLLSDIATEKPTLLAIDDCHWLDSSTSNVLAFVSRRISSEPIGLLGTTRDEAGTPLGAVGLTDVEVYPLDDVAAAALLEQRSPDLSAASRARILSEAAGNPLALVELPALALRASGDIHSDSLPLSAQLERSFAARHRELPRPTRALLLVASLDEGLTIADAIAAASLLAEAAVSLRDFEPASSERLIDLTDNGIRFRHPLVRSAIRQAASVTEVRAAHLALAKILAHTPEREIRHRAASVLGPDEGVATDLEEAATEAARRGAPVEAALALRQAAALSQDARRRAGRLLRAGEYGVRVGRRDLVTSVLEEANLLDLSEHHSARLALIRETFEPGIDGDPSVVLGLVAHAAVAGRNDDPDLALELLISASANAFWADRSAETHDAILRVTEAIGVPPNDPRELAVLAFIAPADDVDAVTERLRPWMGDRDVSPEGQQLLGGAAFILCAHELSWSFHSAAVDGLRAEGRLERLAQSLVMRAWCEIHLGQWDLAAPDAEEALRLAEETSQPIWGAGARAALAWLAAVRGDERQAEEQAAAAERIVVPARSRAVYSVVTLTRGMVELSLGRNAIAYRQLRRMLEPSDLAHHPMTSVWGLASLADAALFSGNVPEAAEVIAQVEHEGERRSSGVYQRMLAHARAVIAPDATAADQFAIALDSVRQPAFDRARLLLAYGTWLRRRRRIVEAREALRAARGDFDALGALPWGERARQELRATGESSIRRTPEALDQLTAQELQVAQMAAAGLSNREIGEKLYLSHRTVSTHLYRIFPKLGVATRSELGKALARAAPSVPEAVPYGPRLDA